MLPAFIDNPVPAYPVKPGTQLFDRSCVDHAAELNPHILKDIFGVFVIFYA
jgi:hypothetical protein